MEFELEMAGCVGSAAVILIDGEIDVKIEIEICLTDLGSFAVGCSFAAFLTAAFLMAEVRVDESWVSKSLIAKFLIDESFAFGCLKLSTINVELRTVSMSDAMTAGTSVFRKSIIVVFVDSIWRLGEIVVCTGNEERPDLGLAGVVATAATAVGSGARFGCGTRAMGGSNTIPRMLQDLGHALSS